MENLTESTLMFDLATFKDYIDLNTTFRSSLFQPRGSQLAIATKKHVIITNHLVLHPDRHPTPEIDTVLEVSQECGRATAVIWIADDIICIGYESGDVACFDVDGNAVSEQKFVVSPVQSFQISAGDATATATAATAAAASADTNSAAILWILYECGVIVTIPVMRFLVGDLDAAVKYKFVEDTVVNDFAILPSVYNPANLFASTGAVDATYSIIVAGAGDTALSLYNLGGRQRFQHLGKFGSYVKDRIGSAFSSIFGSVAGSMGFGGKDASRAGDDENSSYSDLTKLPETAVASMLDFEDSKRRILRLSIDPGGKLLAAADTLGRVTLYDIRLHSFIRLWKGMREAQLAWAHYPRHSGSSADDESNDDDYDSPSDSEDRSVLSAAVKKRRRTRRKPLKDIDSPMALSLAIYAPRLGFVSLYAMRHGPCLRIIPVGAQSQIYTVIEIHRKTKKRLAYCATAAVVDDVYVSIATVDPRERAAGDLDPSVADGNNLSSSSSSSHKSATAADPLPRSATDDATTDAANATSSSAAKTTTTAKTPYELNYLNAPGSHPDVPPEYRVHWRMHDQREEEVMISKPPVYPDGYHDGYDDLSPEEQQILQQQLKEAEEVKNQDRNFDPSSPVRDDAPPEEEEEEFDSEDGEYEEDKTMSKEEIKQYKERMLRMAQGGLSGGGLDNDYNDTEQPGVTSSRSRRKKKRAGGPPHPSIDECVADFKSGRRRRSGGGDQQKDGQEGAVGSSRSRSASTTAAGGGGAGERSKKAPPSSDDSKMGTKEENDGVAAIDLDEAALSTLCRSNSVRAEAACWVVRAMEVQQQLAKKSRTAASATAGAARAAGGSVASASISADDTDKDHHNQRAPRSAKTAVEEGGELGDLVIVPIKLWCSYFLGDIFRMKELNESLEKYQLGGMKGVQRVLPMIMGYFEGLPGERLLSSLLLKPLGLSPLQRWIRDSLFEFHDAFVQQQKEKDAHSDDSSDDEETSSEDNAALSFDERARALLRPAWLRARRSTHPHVAMAFAVIIIEVLFVVEDKVKKVSEGNDSLELSKRSWSNLFRQLRTVMLLQSRLSSIAALQKTNNVKINDPSPASTSAAVGNSDSGSSITRSASVFEELRQVSAMICRTDGGRYGDDENIIKEGGSKGNEVLGENDDRSSGGIERLVSVQNIAHGHVSVYSILAIETLSLCSAADQAIEHEARCAEAFAASAKKASSTSLSSSLSSLSPLASALSPNTLSSDYDINRTKSASTGATTKDKAKSPSSAEDSKGGGGGVLRYWGSAADRRWRELYDMACSEVMVSSISAIKTAAAAATAPPLSTTASSNNSKVSGGSSTKEKEKESNKSTKDRPKRMKPLLLFLPDHIQPSSLGAYRSIHLTCRWVNDPARMEWLQLATEHLFPLPPVMRGAVAERLCDRALLPALMVIIDQESGQNTTRKGDLFWEKFISDVVSKPAAMEAFIKAALELFSFVEQGIDALSGGAAVTAAAGGEEMTKVAAVSDTGNVSSSPTDLGDSDLAVEALYTPSVNDLRDENTDYVPLLLPFPLRKKGDVAPNTTIASSASTMISSSFSSSVYSSSQDEVPWPPVADNWLSGIVVSFCTASSSSDVTTTSEANNLPTKKRIVHMHAALLRILQLRLSCMLPLTQFSLHTLVEHSVLNALGRSGALRSKDVLPDASSSSSSFSSASSSSATTLTNARYDFARACLRVLKRQSVSSLYHLTSELWSLSQEKLMLLHIGVLVEDGNGEGDEEAEHVLTQIQVDHRSDAIDGMITALRKRVCAALKRIEKLPDFGPILAATDADAITWCLTGGGTGIGTTEGTMIINVPSSRHLVVRLRTMLSEASSSSSSSSSSQTTASVDNVASRTAVNHDLISTAERTVQQQSNCDALLTVCDAIIKFEESLSPSDDW